jgi:hypothetical protein
MRGNTLRGPLSMAFVVGVVLAGLAGLSPTGISTASAVSLTPNWLELSPATSPPGRTSASMAYDPATGDVVLFGGADVTSGPATMLSDTWTWDGSTWTQQFPSASPPALYGASLAYDDATDQLVLFGGLSNGGDLSETWTWNGITWTQQVSSAIPTPPVPPARHSASMAYDAASGQLVLFGGLDGRSILNDTWAWNGTTWTQQHPATSPTGRYAATMDYDPAMGNTVLFGGYGGGQTGLSDTWTWNGSTWTGRNPAIVPPARYGASMAFDPFQSEIVLFGGYNNGASDLSDMWTWDGTEWIPRAPTTKPPARRFAAMDYDAATANLVLFGGDPGDSGTPGSLNDTWIWGSGGTFTDSVALPSIVLGATDTATATVTGETGAAAPTGTVTFYACGPTTTPAPCGSQVNSLGGPISLTPGSGDTSTATSSALTPTSAGYWCFAADYSGDTNYAFGPDTTTDACLLVEPPVATTPAVSTVSLGSADSDNATVFGTPADGAPTGSVSFYECGPTNVPTPCTSETNPVGGPVGLTPGSADTSTASSPTFTPDAIGYWCFAGVYSGDSTYSPASDTTTAECVSVVRVFSTSPALSSIVLGASDTDVATAIANAGSAAPTGTVSFYECGPTAVPASCTSQTNPVGGPVSLIPGLANTATATSPSFSPDAVGVWCFAAAYSGDGSYPPSGDATTDECFDVVPVAPTFTSANAATGTPKLALSISITTSGDPVPVITGANLPTWLVLTDNHNGTATLTTTKAHRGKHRFTLTATNVSASTTQVFTLTVRKKAAPALVSGR